MIVRFVSLAFLVCIPGLHATPLDDFRAAVNETITEPLPPFWLTFDARSAAHRRLYEFDWQAYYSRQATAAVNHTRWLRAITGNTEIELDDSGYRADRLAIDSFTTSPQVLFTQAASDREAFRQGWEAFIRLQACKSAKVMLTAITLLLNEAESHDPQTPALTTFIAATKRAAEAVMALIAGEATIDQRRDLLRFLETYGAKSTP